MIELMRLRLIENELNKYYNLNTKFIFHRTRRRALVDYRHKFHYLAWKYSCKKTTLADIGRYNEDMYNAKGWDHTTVIHSKTLIEDLMLTDKTLKHDINEIGKRIRNEILIRDVSVQRTKNYLRDKIRDIIYEINVCTSNRELDKFLITKIKNKSLIKN